MKNLLSGVELNYPSAKEWMWSYCVYLGPFVSDEGKAYDLGIYLGSKLGEGPCAAIVYGHTPGDYISGPLVKRDFQPDYYAETIKRARVLNLI